jgi:hypothetical protein
MKLSDYMNRSSKATYHYVGQVWGDWENDILTGKDVSDFLHDELESFNLDLVDNPFRSSNGEDEGYYFEGESIFYYDNSRKINELILEKNK